MLLFVIFGVNFENQVARLVCVIAILFDFVRVCCNDNTLRYTTDSAQIEEIIYNPGSAKALNFFEDASPATISMVINDGLTIMHYACRTHSHSYKSLLGVLNRCDNAHLAVVINAQCNRGFTPLMMALRVNNARMIHDIGVAGVTRHALAAHTAHATGETILHIAANYSRIPDYDSSKLSVAGADPNPDIDPVTALVLWTCERMTATQVDTPRLDDEFTALRIACDRGNSNMARLLIMCGADPWPTWYNEHNTDVASRRLPYVIATMGGASGIKRLRTNWLATLPENALARTGRTPGSLTKAAGARGRC